MGQWKQGFGDLYTWARGIGMRPLLLGSGMRFLFFLEAQQQLLSGPGTPIVC